MTVDAAVVPSVFAEVVGQTSAVSILAQAAADAAAVRTGAAGTSMTHAWLLTGPPGSGRSVAARAFAAALQCPNGGCGQCVDCHTVRARTHPDVTVVAPEGLSYGVAEARQLVRSVSDAPVRGRWRVVIVEDADRLTEQAGNALLRAIEEPPPRAVFMLCAPTIEDVLPTVRSRCRHVTLRIPSTAAVADVLVRRDGIDPAMAAFAARAAQGHVGRALRLATDEESRRRRRDVLDLPFELDGVGSTLAAAAALVEAANDDAASVTGVLDTRETSALREALGDVGRGVPRGSAAALNDLERRQKSRATRGKRDILDRALLDLAALYRDVLVVQMGAEVELVNDDLSDLVGKLARGSRPAETLRRIEAVMACRTAVDENVNPLLAVEAMALALRAG
jgi:DNA polymerase-3 subunit delta'